MDSIIRQPIAEHVVAIGASAGAIPALSEMLSRFRSDCTAFVLLMHLSPAHRSYLAEILQRSTNLEVVTVLEALRLSPNKIYVTAPGMDLTINGERLEPVPLPPQRFPRRNIDNFFVALARERRERAFGVIMSGSGKDGIKGLAAIRDAGGQTFVQAPDSAQFPEMPRGAQPSAQYSLAPAQLGDELMRAVSK